MELDLTASKAVQRALLAQAAVAWGKAEGITQEGVIRCILKEAADASGREHANGETFFVSLATRFGLGVVNQDPEA